MARVLQLRRGTTAENNLFTGAVAEATYDTSRKELRIHDGSTVGGKVISVSTGIIAPFGGSTAPEGWLVCDGSAISRTDYADLFAVIGTIYGVGDGTLTFNLPDISDCFVQGGTPGTTHNAGLPNITGSTTLRGNNLSINNTSVQTGCFKKGNSIEGRVVGLGEAATAQMLGFDASGSNSIYGNSTTVQPKSVETLICIKY